MTSILFASYRANAGPPRKCLWIFYMTFRFFCRGLQSWVILDFWKFEFEHEFWAIFHLRIQKKSFFVVFLQSVHFEASCDHFKVIIGKPESYWNQKMQQQCVWDISDKILTTRNALVAFTKKLFWRVSKTCPPLIFEKTHFSSFSCNLFTLKRRVIISKLS